MKRTNPFLLLGLLLVMSGATTHANAGVSNSSTAYADFDKGDNYNSVVQDVLSKSIAYQCSGVKDSSTWALSGGTSFMKSMTCFYVDKYGFLNVRLKVFEFYNNNFGMIFRPNNPLIGSISFSVNDGTNTVNLEKSDINSPVIKKSIYSSYNLEYNTGYKPSFKTINISNVSSSIQSSYLYDCFLCFSARTIYTNKLNIGLDYNSSNNILIDTRTYSSVKKYIDLNITNDQRPSTISFNNIMPIPALSVNNTSSLIYNSGTMVIIRNASKVAQGSILPGKQSYDPPANMKFYLLGDGNKSADGSDRCEKNPNAKVVFNGQLIPQTFEMYQPSEAFKKMNSPSIMINANYWDYRNQLSGQTWKTTKCSLPVGMYYDSKSIGPSPSADPYYNPKMPYYYNPDTLNSTPVDTLFLETTPDPSGSKNTYNIIYNNATPAANSDDFQSNRSINYAAALRSKVGVSSFVAVSGTGLLPTLTASQAGITGNDNAPKTTTRLGLGYNPSSDQLIIFEGGGYSNGVSRTDLADILRAMGATKAIELDGGGSAAVVIKDQTTNWFGDTPPTTACPYIGAWCSPVTQPSSTPGQPAQARPDPTWLAFSFE